MTETADPGSARRTRPEDARQRARQILATESAFQACSGTFIDEVMAHAVVIRLAAGETMYARGEPGDSMMIVLSGSLKVTNTTMAENEVILAILEAGATTGEIAVLDGRERTASVVALEPVEAVAIYRHDLLPILEANPDALLALLETTCRRLRATNALVESYSLEGARMFRKQPAVGTAA